MMDVITVRSTVLGQSRGESKVGWVAMCAPKEGMRKDVSRFE